jgi:hypothetical protein
MQQYTLVCDDQTRREIEGLAEEYELTEQEVLSQLVDVGIQELD